MSTSLWSSGARTRSWSRRAPADCTPAPSRSSISAASPIAAAGATALLPQAGQAALQSAPFFPVSELQGLLRISRFRIALVVSALVYGSHAVHNAFAVIRWRQADISTSAISFLWSEAVLAEVLVFMLAGPELLDRLGVRSAAVLAAMEGAIRWSVAGVTTSVLLLSIIQPLHGLTFALLHLACMRMMRTLVAPSVAATAQALYAFGSGVVTAALTFASGALYVSWAGAAFFPMAALCAAALPFAWFGFANGERLIRRSCERRQDLRMPPTSPGCSPLLADRR
ncbi:MFS transporter [Bradyrhizobium zhanjiangense]|uniref:MFS transporter n=1 Tax=Bradyrhizobium zhanjiangense TaxID=1325107 RepID=UPI001008AF9F|nr:MFS transporter [Bradyrhizobium zhanjiangense]